MTIVEELEKWQDDLEALSVERSKAEGRLEQAMSALHDLGYETLEDAQEALDKLGEDIHILETEALKLMETFKEKYGEHIE